MLDPEVEIKELQTTIDQLEQTIKLLTKLKDKKDCNDIKEDIDKVLKAFKTKLKQQKKVLDKKVDDMVETLELIASAEGLK